MSYIGQHSYLLSDRQSDFFVVKKVRLESKKIQSYLKKISQTFFLLVTKKSLLQSDKIDMNLSV